MAQMVEVVSLLGTCERRWVLWSEVVMADDMWKTAELFHHTDPTPLSRYFASWGWIFSFGAKEAQVLCLQDEQSQSPKDLPFPGTPRVLFDRPLHHNHHTHPPHRPGPGALFANALHAQ